MKSVAIWSTPELGIENELHINYWELPCKRAESNFIRFIDIGLKIQNPEPLGSINFLFPFQLADDEIILLNDACCKSSVACAIFNENFSVDSLAIEKFHKFSLDGVPKFYFYDLSRADFTLTPTRSDNEVTRLELKLPDIFPDEMPAFYVRFRVQTDKLERFCSIENLSNAPLQGIISQTETIDFRVNDQRDIGRDLLSETRVSNSFLRFKKIHFFFMCSSQRELSLSNADWLNCRFLEHSVWDDYLPDIDHGAKPVLAYHWKVKAKDATEESESSFSILIKSLIERGSKWTVAVCAIATLVGSLILGCVSNGIYDAIKTTLVNRHGKSQSAPAKQTVKNHLSSSDTNSITKSDSVVPPTNGTRSIVTP